MRRSRVVHEGDHWFATLIEEHVLYHQVEFRRALQHGARLRNRGGSVPGVP